MGQGEELNLSLPASLSGILSADFTEESSLSFSFLNSGVFQLLLLSGKRGLFRIIFLDPSESGLVKSGLTRLATEGKIDEGVPSLVLPIKELRDYFSGKLRKFSMELDIRGTCFQREVFKQLAEIPYGETAAYSDIARDIARPKSARAVGQACNKNPLPVVIPCHRVLGKRGALTGYAPGLSYKKKMLQIEGKKR